MHKRGKDELKVCENGHKFYKKSDCPTCPFCEELKKPKDEFLSKISAPARRALLTKNINSLDDLAFYTQTEIANLHGIGIKAMNILQNMLKEVGKNFAKE